MSKAPRTQPKPGWRPMPQRINEASQMQRFVTDGASSRQPKIQALINEPEQGMEIATST